MALRARESAATSPDDEKAWRPTGTLSARITRLITTAGVILSLVAVLPPLWGAAASRRAALLDQAEAAVVANRSVATTALDIGDRAGATAAVERMGLAAHATSVRLFNNAGEIAASFAPPKRDAAAYSSLAWQDKALEQLPAFLTPELRIARRLDIHGDPVGSVEVLVSSRPLIGALGQQLGLALISVLLAYAVARRVAARLRRQVAEPIHHLLETMDRVSDTQDYLIRARPHGPDEVGSLIISFNQMLEQIHTRNLRLDENRRKLRELVVERTKNFEAAAREAEMASRAKGDFLARMSHEIRTPMNGVVGMADLLENTRLEEDQHRMLRTMRSSADSLLEIINGILDFSRIEAGQLNVLETEFSAVEVIEEVCELLAPRAHERNLELVCDIDPAVPVSCTGDPIRLRQIITNLLGNAVKYTEHGQIILRAGAGPASDGRTELRIEVEDTGLGIPEHQLQTVFDAFTQGDSFETRKHGGTGLGLAISKQLVTLLGGEIGLNSTVGAGTTAWVTVPLSTPNPGARTTVLSPAGVKSVLLIQDHDAGLRALTTQFEAAGARVWSVRTGHRALEQVGVDNFDLAVIDELLGDMTGFELIDRLRSLPAAARLPVVMMTSTKPSVASALAGIEHSTRPDARFAKPFRREQLLEAVTTALGGGKAKKAAGGADVRRKLGLRVLLVEDSAVNREVATGMLQAIGCSVESASDGALGVEQALSWGFDVIFMDCQMPLMDGYEATARIRAAETAGQRKRMPIIALTANALQGDRERCLAAGMTDFVSKPFTIAKLYDALRALLDNGAVAGRKEDTPRTQPAEPAAASSRPAAASARVAPPVLDMVQIEELRSLGRPEILRQAMALFQKQVTQNLDELDGALHRAELQATEQVAHAIKSASLSMGGRRLAAIAGVCELAARRSDLEAARKLARHLRPEFSRLCRALAEAVDGTERAA
jgi:two-component system sensor histidine kinase/response regulator